MARDVEAGKAFIKLALSGKGQVERGLRGVGSHIRSIAGLAGKLSATIGAIGLGAGFISSIKAASDMQETMSKFNVVFGESSEAVKKWGDDLGASLGRSKKQMAAFLSSSQDLLVPLGFDAEEAKELSKQITQLAIDLGSFNNIADEDVFRDLQAALTGSGEVMKKYGVVVSEARVKQELLNQSIDPKIATEAQKAMARFNLILQGTKAAQGDALRTSESFANQWKRLQAVIADVSVELGEKFLPAVATLVSVLGDAIVVLSGVGTEGKASMGAIELSAEAVIDALGVMVETFNQALARLKLFIASFHALKAVTSGWDLKTGTFVDEAANQRAQKLISEAEQLMMPGAGDKFKEKLRALREERRAAANAPLVNSALGTGIGVALGIGGAGAAAIPGELSKIKTAVESTARIQQQQHASIQTLGKGTIEAAQKQASNQQKQRDEKQLAELRDQTQYLADISRKLDDTDQVEVLN